MDDAGPSLQGQAVSQRYNVGFIVLSCFVSVIGCWTALELLHKRTTTRGYYNWVLLLGAAIAMGAVAIWSMHFIGNQAIILAGGNSNLQIAYNSVWTAGSFMLAIGGVAFAFFMFTITERVSVWRTLLGGLLTGAAICGMHYMGQAGISNYKNIFEIKSIVGAAIIAVFAATCALGLFFYLKSTWTNALWKRLCCAFVLGSGVSGMHWLAAFGTSYRSKAEDAVNSSGLSREMTVTIVGVLAMSSCLMLTVVAIFGQRSRKQSASQAQQVVLSCAVWDPDGRLLVTPAGLLPCQKISNSSWEKSFEDIFAIDHPAFCWIFRVSRCWASVADLIPAMRAHLHADHFVSGCPEDTGTTVTTDSSPLGRGGSAQAFKELFCVAANDLAEMLGEKLENIGVLYDQIVNTGTIKKKSAFLPKSGPVQTRSPDVEANTYSALGRGQLLFVVRHVNRPIASRLQAAGFCFAPISNIIDELAKSMQITVEELRPHLDEMQEYPFEPKMLEPGVHVVFFALRPLFQRGFDILVRKAAKNLLPSAKLPLQGLERWHLDIIRSCDNWTVGQILSYWRRRSMNTFEDSDHETFFGHMVSGLRELGQEVGEELFSEARLTARPLRSPCCPDRHVDGSPAQAILIAFRLITDVHELQTQKIAEFTSAKFFLCQQHVYPNSPDHLIFTQQVHREFAAVAEEPDPGCKGSSELIKNRCLRILNNITGLSALTSWMHNLAHPDISEPMQVESSSEKNLVEVAATSTFGGIHVSREITVDSTEIGMDQHSPELELMTLGVHSEAGVASIERDSYVDELMALTIRERRYQRP